jgi:hypothetical protein
MDMAVTAHIADNATPQQNSRIKKLPAMMSSV